MTCNQVLGLNPEQWSALAAIGTLAAVVVALVIAVWQDRMKQWLFRPKLVLSYEMKPPYCQKTLISNGKQKAQCYYFRLRVENAGRRQAEDVTVLAADLLKADEKGAFSRYQRFLPMHLTWSHDRKISQSISSGLFRFIDLCHIVDPENRKEFDGEDFIVTFAEIFLNHEITEEMLLSFDTEVKPFTSSHIVPSGRYRMVLLIGARDIGTKKYHVDVAFAKDWFVNQDEMFAKGISIHLRE